MDESPSDRAAQRLAKSLEAVATFVKIGEELVAIRAATPEGPDRERLDRIIQLNRDTLAVVKRSLTISENDVARRQR